MEMRTRRWFLRGAIGSVVASAGAILGISLVRGADPFANPLGGFGFTVIPPHTVAEIHRIIRESKRPYYYKPGRFYLVPYDGSRRRAKPYVKQGLVAGGLVALYQRCTHLGAFTAFCESSQWFECHAHGSMFNMAGEYKLGPAPRGMDRFPIRIVGDHVQVATGVHVPGPARGTNTTAQEPAGPFCVDTTAAHEPYLKK